MMPTRKTDGNTGPGGAKIAVHCSLEVDVLNRLPSTTIVGHEGGIPKQILLIPRACQGSPEARVSIALPAKGEAYR